MCQKADIQIENLAKAAKELSDALTRLLGSLGASSNKACDEALESILKSTNDLDEKLDEPTGKNIHETLLDLTTGVRTLANLSSAIVASARTTPEHLATSSVEAAAVITKVNFQILFLGINVL